MKVNCEQCGRPTDDPQVILWARDMGKLCQQCFDEIAECPPVKRKAELSPALQKAHEARSENAKRNKQLKEDLRQARIESLKNKREAKAEAKRARIEADPEKYQKKLDALAKARAAKNLKPQEPVEQPVEQPKEELAGISAGAVPSPVV